MFSGGKVYLNLRIEVALGLKLREREDLRHRGGDWIQSGGYSVEGNRMTKVKSGRISPFLSSQTCITDSEWHRIGFVRDGAHRHLYFNGIEVAMGATPLSCLAGAEGGLYLGVGNDFVTASFWPGLVDDVRIYNRVLSR